LAYHASIGKRVQSPQATDLVVPEMGEPVDGVDPEYGRPDEEPARRAAPPRLRGPHLLDHEHNRDESEHRGPASS
jgi:hypothetical protein